MSHSSLHRAFAHLARLSFSAQKNNLSLDDARAERAVREEQRLSRRQLLGGLAALGAVAGVSLAVPARARPVGGQPRIAIIGAGLSGLACAERLTRSGFIPTLYEAHPNRIGGRVFTDHTTFPGQVAELGGEMIDTLHKTVLGYAQTFGLAREDLEHAPGATAFHFFGQLHDEDAVVEEYRVLVERMRPDFRSISSGGPSFYRHTEADRALDDLSLEAYLAMRASDLPLIRNVLTQAYISEYGLETGLQSCLNFLQFIHLDRRRHFAEFGVFSDERYHLVGGNDALVNALANHVSGLGCVIHTGAPLSHLSRNASGEFELTIAGRIEYADAVVITVPFRALRERVTLDPSLGLSPDKRRAIDTLGYGENVKTAVRFNQRVWAQSGFNGLAYSDLPNVQNTWETNYGAAPADGGGILTDYAGGERGHALQLNPTGSFGCGGCHDGVPSNAVLKPTGAAHIAAQIEAFVAGLDHVFPGAAAAASRRPGGALVAQRAHWSPQPTSRGSYTVINPVSSARSRASRPKRSVPSSSPANTRTRSRSSRDSWRAPATPGSGLPTRSWTTFAQGESERR